MNRLRDLREDCDKSQKDIASILNITQQQYSLYELGKREIPLSITCILAKYYQTSIDYIVGRTNEKSTYPNNQITDSYFNYLINNYKVNKTKKEL